MGREASCQARLGRQTSSSGKALLETTELIFRGDFRVKVPFQAITRVDAQGPNLTVVWPEGELTLALGPTEAPKWVEKIRHPRSRLDKLGVKPEMVVAVVGKVDADFLAELAGRGARVVKKPTAPVNLIFAVAETSADLARLPGLKDHLLPDGGLWVLRRKGSDTVSEGDVRTQARAAGLVGVKVAAFSATHTADKFVIPVAARGKPAKSIRRS